MKLTTLATHLSPIIPLLRCPKCGSTVTLEQDRSLVCENRHCYDLSAKGYANLAPSRDQNTDKYNAALFESRSAIFNAGFYAPIAQALCAAVKRHHTGVQRSYKTIQPSVTPDASASFTSPIVLDAGCGEGYYTRALCDAIPNATVIGGDLSRDAIIAAARQAHETPWLVADLTRLPLADGCIDALIDVLTPADYREFARVLHPDGLLYKVIPADDYLTEIRSAIASHLADANFSNARVLEHL